MEKEGRGDIIRRHPSHFPVDSFDHVIDIRYDNSAVEPQNFETQTGQIMIPLFIYFYVITDTVLGAIYFNDEIRYGRVEIHNVPANRLLSIKLHSQHLFPPQP